MNEIRFMNNKFSDNDNDIVIVINILNTIGYIHTKIDKLLCTITYELCTKILGE